MKVEKARIGDVQTIYELIKKFADKGEMLPRALSELYENLRDYFVIRNDQDQVIACVALHVNWEDLAEIRSLVVNEDHQSKGLGSSLVKSCLDEAETLGIKNVFCLTYKPEFFEKHGFRKVILLPQLNRKQGLLPMVNMLLKKHLLETLMLCLELLQTSV